MFSKADKNYWGRPEVQEGARMRLVENIRKTLRQKTVIACPEVYKDWKRYVKTFTRVGGVIEACPPDVRGSPSANLLIEPTGAVTLISTQDQIFATPYRYCGTSFPQKTVPNAAIRGAALAICTKLFFHIDPKGTLSVPQKKGFCNQSQKQTGTNIETGP